MEDESKQREREREKRKKKRKREKREKKIPGENPRPERVAWLRSAFFFIYSAD